MTGDRATRDRPRDRSSAIVPASSPVIPAQAGIS
jgi:hypothetical protein